MVPLTYGQEDEKKEKVGIFLEELELSIARNLALDNRGAGPPTCWLVPGWKGPDR